MGGMAATTTHSPLFRTGWKCLPHPNKLLKNADPGKELSAFGGGEDSGFIEAPEEDRRRSIFFGVADGVGGWARYKGASPERFSRLLCHNAVEYIRDQDDADKVPLREIMHYAHSTIPRDLMGSSTFLIMRLSPEGVLESANMGDSGYLVLRDGKPLFRGQELTHGFNFPYQLGPFSESDKAEQAYLERHKLQPGDIIIAGTDGLFDNMFDEEIASLVAQAQMDPSRMAAQLAAISRRLSMCNRDSPFAIEARNAGRLAFASRGKLDDVLVVVVLYNGYTLVTSKL